MNDEQRRVFLRSEPWLVGFVHDEDDDLEPARERLRVAQRRYSWSHGVPLRMVHGRVMTTAVERETDR
jgi:hypothetical protein